MAPIFTVGAQSFTSEAKSFQMGANLQWNSGHGGGVNKQALMRHGQTRLELTELLHSTATSDSGHTSGCRTGWSRWCLCCRSASCCRRRGWSRRSSGRGWCVRDSLQINFLAQISNFKMNQIKSSKYLNIFPVSSTVNPPDIANQRRGTRYFTSILVLAVKQYELNKNELLLQDQGWMF